MIKLLLIEVFILIIEAVLNLLQAAIFSLFSWLELPDLPLEITNGINDFFSFLQYGAGFIGFFLPARLIRPLFVTFSAIFAVDCFYPFIMWIIRKIPLSID